MIRKNNAYSRCIQFKSIIDWVILPATPRDLRFTLPITLRHSQDNNDSSSRRILIDNIPPTTNDKPSKGAGGCLAIRVKINNTESVNDQLAGGTGSPKQQNILSLGNPNPMTGVLQLTGQNKL
jgi:hypothetical protein